MVSLEKALHMMECIREPSDEVLEALWLNMPGAYEIDTEDRAAAINLLRAILIASGKNRQNALFQLESNVP